MLFLYHKKSDLIDCDSEVPHPRPGSLESKLRLNQGLLCPRIVFCFYFATILVIDQYNLEKDIFPMFSYASKGKQTSMWLREYNVKYCVLPPE